MEANPRAIARDTAVHEPPIPRARRRNGKEEPSWSYRRWRPKVNAADLCSILSEGDIILFKGARRHEGCQQWLLRSEYNHVAMVIKAGDTIESITLHVLESELSQGVSKRPLSYYLECSRWARLNVRFSQIAVRRLYVNGQRLDLERKHHLYRFVAQALGKAYPTGVHGVVTMARAFMRLHSKESGRKSSGKLPNSLRKQSRDEVSDEVSNEAKGDEGPAFGPAPGSSAGSRSNNLRCVHGVVHVCRVQCVHMARAASSCAQVVCRRGGGGSRNSAPKQHAKQSTDEVVRRSLANKKEFFCSELASYLLLRRLVTWCHECTHVPSRGSY